MTRRTQAVRLLPLALFVLTGARAKAQTWWNPDYTQRVGVTITNNDASATPVPTSVEVPYKSGHKESTGVGTTDYTTLPVGTKLTFSSNGASLDDNTTVVTLPFSFPWVGGATNQVVVAIDGYIAPGAVDLGRPDKPADIASRPEIIPWSSDFAITDTATQGVYADLQATQATFRWELQESASGPIIAKFAAILKPDGSIRFVYGSPCDSPSAAIADFPNTSGAYSPIKFGIGGEDASVIHFPAFPASNTGHADLLYSFIPPAPWRSDFNDVRALYWSGSAWQELDRQVLIDSAAITRVVFRLVNPIAAGGNSTGQYFLYFANPSPQLNAPSSVYNIYDHVEDFLSSANVVGSLAPNWVSGATADTMTVVNVGGVKMGQIAGPDHPRGVVKSSAMPAFLNAELYARFFPSGGEAECAPMVRAVGSATNGYADQNRAYTGGFGYVMDGFGSQEGPVSYVNSALNTGPADMGVHGTYHGAGGVFENSIVRITDTLSGKFWKDLDPQPAWFDANIALTKNNPAHDGVPDPLWDQPGTVGMGTYSNAPTIQFMAIREIRNLAAPLASIEAGPAFGPGLQGVISSSRLGPLPNLHFTISDGTTTLNLITGPNGQYHISLPPGTYSITAGSYAHTTTTVSGLSPSVGTQTNVVLPYVGLTISGVAREALSGAPMAGATIVVLDSNGYNVAMTTANSLGHYSVLAPGGGTVNVSAMGTNGMGDRKPVTGVAGGTATLNLSGTLISNGDAETPDVTNTTALQWSGAFDNPTAYVYSRDQNHTPGGHWSVAILNPSTPDQPNHLSGWNPPPSGFYNLPVLSSIADIKVTLWVYFSKAGQKGRLRLRNSWPVSGIISVAGQAPDANNANKGGLDVNGKVPVGQWYEMSSTVTAGTTLSPADTLAVDAYAYNSAGGGSDGIVYFDDFTITVTPKSSALGKVVDSLGNPIAGAYVGAMTNAGGLGGDNLLTGPFVFSDDSGNFTLFQASDGAIKVGAWAPVLPGTTGFLPNYGNLIGTATLNTVANPSGRTTVTVAKAGVVSIGAAGNAGGRNDASVAQSVDNSLATRWDSGGGANADVTVTYDLGSVKTIDQIEIFWEAATPDAFTVEADTDINTPNTVMEVGIGGQTLGILGLDITPFNEGAFHIIRLPAPTSARYIKVHPTAYGTFQNYSIIEMRALSAAATVPALTRTDAATVLRIAGGLATSTQADLFKYDVTGDGKITAADAVAIAKQAP